MKAQELMIGDWVEYRFTRWTEKGGVYKDYQYVQISSIGKLYIKADNDRVASADGEEFYPIPLTSEILEKNGWEHKWWWVHPSTRICFQEKITGDFRVMPDTECDKRDWFATIKYVHELQHLYKLCGIEKDVVL